MTADTASERAHQSEPASLVNKLYVADRGDFSIKDLNRIDEAGGFFIVRASVSINPRIVTAHRADGTSLPHLEGGQTKNRSLSAAGCRPR